MSLNKSRAALLAIADRRVGQLALTLNNEIKVGLSQPGTGRVYRKDGRVHQASAPGQAPAPDQGELRRSWLVRKLEPGTYRIASHLSYAAALEFGTRRLAPRPYLRPAVERLRAR
jgi:hypothetical protein